MDAKRVGLCWGAIAVVVGIAFLYGWQVYQPDTKATNILMRLVTTGRQGTPPISTVNNLSLVITEKTEYNGYILGWDYYEEQTCAARNMLGLQHWATTVDFGVVEPFVWNSYYRATTFFRDGKSLRFRDYFNITEWNYQVVSAKNGKPLVTWEHFIESASRQLIVVYIVMSSPQTSVYIDKAITKQCLSMRRGFDIRFLSPFNFKIVRQVCIAFNPRSPLPVHDFNNDIFGNFNVSNVTLVFTFCPGVFGGRISLKETTFNHKFAEWLFPSERVINDSKKYINMFLGNQEYVAVVVRSVKLGISMIKGRKMPKELFAEFLLKNCTNEIAGILSNFSGAHFLALDVGRFGDPSARSYMTPTTVKQFIASIVKTIYNGKWNTSQWEQSFISATGGVTDSGYIASVQKTIVSRASRVIMAGSGSFLSSLQVNRKQFIGQKNGMVYSACKPI